MRAVRVDASVAISASHPLLTPARRLAPSPGSVPQALDAVAPEEAANDSPDGGPQTGANEGADGGTDEPDSGASAVAGAAFPVLLAVDAATGKLRSVRGLAQAEADDSVLEQAAATDLHNVPTGDLAGLLDV